MQFIVWGESFSWTYSWGSVWFGLVLVGADHFASLHVHVAFVMFLLQMVGASLNLFTDGWFPPFLGAVCCKQCVSKVGIVSV